jgi:hypothetical protein
VKDWKKQKVLEDIIEDYCPNCGEEGYLNWRLNGFGELKE